MSRLFRFAPLLLALLLGARPAAADDVVRLGNLRFVQYGALSYMQEIGHQYGLTIQERFFEKGIDAMAQLKAGEIDIGGGATDVAIAAHAGGTPLYIVAGIGRGGATLIARKAAHVTRWEDLKGKKVAVLQGAVQELLLYAELVQHKLTWAAVPGQDVLVVRMKAAPEAKRLLEEGSVDAVLSSDPYASQALATGNVVEVTKPYDTPLGEPVRALVMSKAMYERHDVALRVLRCFAEATRLFIAKPDLAEKHVRQHLFGGKLTHEDYVASVTNGSFTIDITLPYVQNTAYYMVKYGAGKLPVHPIATDFVRLDLLEEVKRAGGAK